MCVFPTIIAKHSRFSILLTLEVLVGLFIGGKKNLLLVYCQRPPYECDGVHIGYFPFEV